MVSIVVAIGAAAACTKFLTLNMPFGEYQERAKTKSQPSSSRVPSRTDTLLWMWSPLVFFFKVVELVVDGRELSQPFAEMEVFFFIQLPVIPHAARVLPVLSLKRKSSRATLDNKRSTLENPP